MGKRRRKDREKAGRRKGTIREESTRPEAQEDARRVSPKDRHASPRIRARMEKGRKPDANTAMRQVGLGQGRRAKEKPGENPRRRPTNP